MWYINLVYFFSTKTMRIAKIHFGHCVGKYDPYYWITPWLLCRDRNAAARRCACFVVVFVVVFFLLLKRRVPITLYSVVTCHTPPYVSVLGINLLIIGSRYWREGAHTNKTNIHVFPLYEPDGYISFYPTWSWFIMRRFNVGTALRTNIDIIRSLPRQPR